jgi:hypothetical protein
VHASKSEEEASYLEELKGKPLLRNEKRKLCKQTRKMWTIDF